MRRYIIFTQIIMYVILLQFGVDVVLASTGTELTRGTIYRNHYHLLLFASRDRRHDSADGSRYGRGFVFVFRSTWKNVKRNMYCQFGQTFVFRVSWSTNTHNIQC